MLASFVIPKLEILPCIRILLPILTLANPDLVESFLKYYFIPPFGHLPGDFLWN